jgi:hypothetical protein
LASQLGAVTVSAVPDEQSAEVGGVQNTVTNLGASIGTALAGAVLVSGLTASFLTGVQDNPAVPQELASQAEVELAGGIPFIPDDALRESLTQAGITGDTADAIVATNEESRIDGLRSALFVLALLALLALFLTSGIPVRQAGSATHEADA